MKRITKAEALRALKNAVARRGENHKTEDGGLYFHENGKPSCIVGEALFHEWNVKKKDLNKFGTWANGNGIEALAERLREEKMLDFTERAVDLLGLAQGQQDNGVPWGEAVRRAVKGASAS